MAQVSEKFAKLKAREESLLFRTYGRYPVSVIKGKGSLLWDVDGKEYVDLLTGIAVTSLGHCNSELVACVKEQAEKLWHVSNLFYQEEQLELAEKLLSTCHMDKAFFCNSGAEANEALIKLARRYMQRVKKREAYEIISISGCFHGRTLATVAATGGARFQDGFLPMPEGFVQVAWGDMDALEKAVNPKTAGILLEVVQGEGGIRPISPEYIENIEKLCRAKDILFLVDEIQTGLCRTGKFWGFQNYNVKPDIISMAKALANGIPMGGILATDTVAAGFEAGSHATTFGGNALASGVAKQCIEIMLRDELAKRAAELGNDFMQKTRALAEKLPGTIKEVRGYGLMLGIDLAIDGKPVWEALLAKGFILNLTQDTVLRLLPALTIEQKHLDSFLVALEEILTNYSSK